MKNLNIKKLVINFVPIILIFLLVTYTEEFSKFSHTILGKAFAIVLILFYSKLDILSGVFVCILVILFYQSDYVESFNNMLNVEGFDESTQTTGPAKIQQSQETLETSEKMKSIQSQPESQSETPEELSQRMKLQSQNVSNSVEKFENLKDAYPLDLTAKIDNDAFKNKNQFRNMHCKNGHLIHKGQIVNPEMAEHVFPNIKRDDYHKCNICDPSCEFEIIDNRIIVESELMAPKSSNDMFDKVWTNLKTTTQELFS